MTRNPFEPPANANIEISVSPMPAGKTLIWKRLLFWFLGFVVLFLSNVLVESLILPSWGLENTPSNDLYFKMWWMLVGVWLVFGFTIVSALQRSTGVR